MSDTKSKKSSGKIVPELHFKRLGREFAMQYLFQYDVNTDDIKEGSLELFWEQAKEIDAIPASTFKRACRYAKRLIDGVIESSDEINGYITKYSKKWDIDRIGVVERNLMRIAIYEMVYCEDVPNVVSIDEAVEIVKDFSTEQSINFVNGILNAVMHSLK